MPALRLSIRVTTDRMAAFASVAASSEVRAASEEAASGAGVREVRTALAAAGVVAGVDDAVVTELAAGLKEPSFERAELKIATGTPATHGDGARIELSFEQGLAPGLVSDDGHMNFFERGLLKVVTAGAVVARLFAPGVGKSGTTVTGEMLAARAGVVTRLKLGAGVTVDAERVVRARHDGAVLYKPEEMLDVVAEHVHQGAVDLRTGHLDMQGSLTVKGDVERLLRARASGDLEVLGSVSGGSLRAGGSIRVSGNVRGGDGARVVAGHDVTVKSCESAEITAGGALRVQEAVNSQLSGQHVVVVGRLRGGAAVAERSLVVKEAGTPNGTATLLHAGEPLQVREPEDVQRAVVMQKLRRMAERGGVRDAFGSRAAGLRKGGKLGRVNAALSSEELQDRAELSARRAALVQAAVVELGVAHPGVELRIGSARLGFEQTVRGLRYAFDSETGQLRAERIPG